MQESTSLVETLRANNYYLMTNEEGNEVYDDDGNLLLYQAEGGQCVSVSNTEEVRRLYDLPLDTPEIRDTIKKDDVRKPGSFVQIPSEKNRIVWVGQRNEHSMKATKMLIELFDSPKYQILMKNPNTVKLKVWEKIATELEASGFKIATSTREAGLRTFQKWRNMERTYWKYMKTNPDECGEDKRKKKPYFFDDLHIVMVKREKELSLESNPFYCAEDGNCKPGDDDDEFEEGDVNRSRAESELLKRKRISDLYGTDCEAFPREALSLLTSLVTSPKYDECLKDKLYTNKTKVWESIYMDMMKSGWKFGTSIREGALILSEKWRMVEKTILRKKLCGPRTLYTPTFRKAVLMEVERRKNLGPNYLNDLESPPELTIPTNRKPKGGEIEPEAIEALLKVVGSGHYQNLFATAGGKRAKIWEKIFDEVQSQGFEIAGATKREKVTRLFQKWRNMKRAFVKYHIAKFRGRDVKKPMFHELMFNIISKDVLNICNSECDSDEEIRMDEWDEDSESEYPPDFLEISQTDHDYGEAFGADESVTVKTLQLPSNMETEPSNPVDEPVKHAGQSPPQPKPSTSRPSRSHEVLRQIKSLQETSLAMQQQNFSKIISLLENQINEQTRLTNVICDYIMSQKIKSSSKNGHRRENSSHNPTNHEKRNDSFNDNHFLS